MPDYIKAFVAETETVNSWALKPKDYASGCAILDAPSEVQASVLVQVCEQVRMEASSGAAHRLSRLASALLTRSLPFTAADLERLMIACRRQSGGGYYYPPDLWGGVTRGTRRFLEAGNPLTSPMREALAETRSGMAAYPSKDLRKICDTIGELLGDTQAGLPDPGEDWADAAIAEVSGSAAWAAVFMHTGTADSGKPTAKWLAEAEKNRQAVGGDVFRQRVTAWMRLTSTPLAFDRPAPVYNDYVQAEASTNYVQANEAYRAALHDYHNSISEKNITILKGLTWYCAPLGNAALARAVGHLAEQAFGNVRERGAWAKSAGNAAIWALGQMPGGMGVGPLARLRTRLRDRGALKLIASSIETAAKSAGMTVDELEDLAVPTGGLGMDGTRREVFGVESAGGSEVRHASLGGG